MSRLDLQSLGWRLYNTYPGGGKGALGHVTEHRLMQPKREGSRGTARERAAAAKQLGGAIRPPLDLLGGVASGSTGEDLVRVASPLSSVYKARQHSSSAYSYAQYPRLFGFGASLHLSAKAARIPGWRKRQQRRQDLVTDEAAGGKNGDAQAESAAMTRAGYRHDGQ